MVNPQPHKYIHMTENLAMKMREDVQIPRFAQTVKHYDKLQSYMWLFQTIGASMRKPPHSYIIWSTLPHPQQSVHCLAKKSKIYDKHGWNTEEEEMISQSLHVILEAKREQYFWQLLHMRKFCPWVLLNHINVLNVVRVLIYESMQ